jgi:hypothetical protein
MKNKYLKLGGIILAIIIAFFVYRYVSDRQMFAKMDAEPGNGNLPVSKRQYFAYLKYIEDRNKADNFGSTTPEGTLQLFVDALKKEDVNLAAKYFVPEKQVKEKEGLTSGLKNGGIKTMFSYMENYPLKKSYIDYMNEYEFRWTDKDGVNVIMGFRLNKFTNKWKIESL